MRVALRPASVALIVVAALFGVAAPTTASALSPDNPICGAAGVLSQAAATGCAGIGNGGQLLTAGKQLVTGNVNGAVNTAVGGAAQAVASTASTALGVAAIATGVVGAAQAVLNETASALGQTTAPQLHTTWFSSTYWRMSAIAAVLTLPFLFAAAMQALIRSDLGLLVRAALGYLPLATLAVAIAAPVTMLLLAASDELCGFISSAASNASAHFLARAGVAIGGLTAITQSPFLAFLVGLFTIAAAFALWIELLMREAAVYVIVLMLPLAFAAMVWPARRIWAIRAVELLMALILSKFAIVAVLSLGGAAISAGAADQSLTAVMVGAVLISLAAFSPWALLRIIPLMELASGAAGSLRAELRPAGAAADAAWRAAEDWSATAAAAMRQAAQSRWQDTDSSPQNDRRPSGDPQRPSDDDDGGEAPDGGGPSDGGGPPDGGGQPDGGGPPDAGDSPGSGDPPPATPDALDWARQPALELGPAGLGATPVWPHPDAGAR